MFKSRPPIPYPYIREVYPHSSPPSQVVGKPVINTKSKKMQRGVSAMLAWQSNRDHKVRPATHTHSLPTVSCTFPLGITLAVAVT